MHCMDHHANGEEVEHASWKMDTPSKTSMKEKRREINAKFESRDVQQRQRL